MYTKYPYIEFSGALQQITTPHIRKANEVNFARNADFTKVIGAFVRRGGSQKYDSVNYPTIPTSPIDKPTLGAYAARYPTGAELWMASNIGGDASATLRRWDGVSSWVDVKTGLIASSEVNFTYDLDEVWVSYYSASTDTIGASFTVDATHNVSTTRQLQFAPNARFFTEFNGYMYAANCAIGSTRYRDRLYQSSGPTGVVAFARSAQTDVPAEENLTDNVPTMTSDSTPLGAALSSSNSTGFNPYKAFDDQDLRANSWFSSATTGWVGYDFGSGNSRIVTDYSIRALPSDAVLSPYDDRQAAPKTWTFEGSLDAITWVVLDTQTNASGWVADERRYFTTTNTLAYRAYRVNVSVSQWVNDSLQHLVTINELELLSSTAGTKALTLDLDSARYTKPGQILDVYTSGTNNLLFPITVLDVDKINDSITFLPYQLNFATSAVNTSTDVITLSDATQFSTGTTIRFLTTAGLPAPLVAGTIYYAIYLTSTTIKLATTLTNAQLGVAINLTTTGSGTHTILLSYVIGNKDELWGVGRKGLLTRYWNTDYRDPTSADWLKLPATLDATNDITAVGTIASRLFIWTENAMFKYDGANLTPLYNDVGCIAMKTVCYYESFMVWLDAKGQIWTRNELAGTQTVISTPIQKTIALIPMDLLANSSAVCVGRKFKLTLGQITVGTGTMSLRLVYDFEANTWTTETFSPKMPVQIEYKYSGDIKPHFFDEHGNFWVDELGNDDAGQPIHMDVQIGPDTLQVMSMRSMSQLEVDEVKNFRGAKVYGEKCTGSKLLVSIDKGDWIECGEMSGAISVFEFPKTLPKGTMINTRVTNSATGDPVEIHRIVIYFNVEEDTLRVTNG